MKLVSKNLKNKFANERAERESIVVIIVIELEYIVAVITI